MDKIARLRQEIERLKKENDNIKCDSNRAYCLGYGDAFVDLLPFLDTLSKEPMQKFNTDKLQEIAKPATPHKKPTPEDRAKFMEELHEYAESKKPDKRLEEAAIGNYYGGGYVPKNQELREIALKTKEVQSFIAGAEWQASQMPMPEDTVLFQKGVAEGRRLEREDSVECEVTDVGFNYLDLALFDAESLELKAGDKIKMIVLKDNEDESK